MIDPELLEAFLPEFRASCAALAAAADQPVAARAIDQLRAMAAALEDPGIKSGVEDAALLLDPFEPDLLPDAARMLLDRADALAPPAEAGAPPPAEQPSPAATPAATPAAAPAPALQPAEAPVPAGPALDPELLEALLPEFAGAAARLAAARDLTESQRAIDVLGGLVGAAGIASLRAMLAEAPALLDPYDPAGLSALAATLAAQAEAIGRAGHDLPAAPPPPPAEPAAPAGPRIRALVVDDSALMRRLVRETLQSDPAFEVVGEAVDGADALRRMEELSPDLTMLDIEMPILDGIGVLRAWSLAGTGAVVIVSSAARPGSPMAIEARRLGAASVVGKPSGAFSPDLRDRQGQAIRRAARRAVGLPQEVEA